MREILFRAKRIDNGNWVEGMPFQEWSDFWGDWLWIIQTKHPLTNVPFLHLEIDRKTISQFTGLNDKNGKKIFEGDILSSGWGYKGEVEFDSIMYAKLECLFNEDCEIIGNIHDNPELLEDME